jgi:hypothetical protein
MSCSLCGEVCQCVPSPVVEDTTAEREGIGLRAPEVPTLRQDKLLTEEDVGSWRKEVTERLSRYHAKRRPRPPRYPSLRLKFDTPDARWSAPPSDPVLSAPSAQATAQACAVTRQAVAVNYVEPLPEASSAPEIQPADVPTATPKRNRTEHSAKLIEFPRTNYSPDAWAGDLAEPILNRPRILEAPELVPPPPALGGVTIEEVAKPEPERRPGVDMPLRSAPIGQRFSAGLIDGAVVFASVAMFGAAFYRIAGLTLPLLQIAEISAGMLVVCWVAYQYLLVVYSGSTLGLRMLRLQIQRFDGSSTNRKLRRTRVLCSLLSAASLGLGYAWLFLDEDGLCWHERVTKTHIAAHPQTR